jgi:Zn-dependent M16 (insulinase) family peptidase
VLFTVANQTYSTFVNAMTSSAFTAYPISSMSEDQLLKLTDVYLDCVFNPAVYTNRNIFLREAWRYEMQDADSPLTVNGTVYNEMKGSLGNISTAASYNTLKVLYPDSYQSNISGGDPEKITDLTYEQLIKTHETYYHPSNSLMILYGNLDYARFLKLINDEYLSKFDKKEIKVDYKKVAPFNEKVEKSFNFAVSADSNTANAAQTEYAFALSDVGDEDLLGLAILASVLNQETSPLKQAFNERKIGGSLDVYLNENIIQPVLTFSVTGADPNKAGEFRQLVDDCISDLVKNGYDKELIDATISFILLNNSSVTEQSNLGINLSLNLSSMWANYDNLDYYNNLIKYIKNISNKVGSSYFEDLTKKYIQNNNHAALVSTVPEAGLVEKKTEQQQKYLADLKASMSADEIERIVSDTKAYNEWNSRETSAEEAAVIKDLQVVSPADLPLEAKTYDLKDTKGPDGERIISAKADVGETGITMLLTDTSAVPAEKLHYLQLCTTLLGKLDTAKYKKEQLATLSMRHLNGVAASLSLIPQKDTDKFTPVLIVSWLGLMGEYSDQMDLVKEILLNTKFDDSETVLNLVRSQIANLKSAFTSNPINLVSSRNTASIGDSYNYMNYISGIEYYNFLVQLEQALQEDPKAVLDELDAVHKLILNKTNMVAAFAGNESGIKIFEDNIKSLTDALPAKEIIPQDYSKLPVPARKEAISIDTAVQYNMISASYEDMGTEYNGKYIPIVLMINDIYLTPQLRYNNGVYTVLAEASRDLLMMLTYRDPNIKETFDIYKGVPDFVKNINITQEDLDRYILNAYSTYTSTSGELNGATNYISEYLMGRTAEDKLKLLREIKSVTVQDIRDSAAVFEKALENGAYTTAGSAAKIDENKDLYDAVILFGQQKNSDEPITMAQFIELVLAGVQNPVEVAKQQGLLLGDGKGNYGENEPLTKERLAVFINRIAAIYGANLNGDDAVIADIDSVSPWARSSVKALVGTGVAKLDEDGSFDPKDTVTESDVSIMMNDLFMILSGQ